MMTEQHKNDLRLSGPGDLLIAINAVLPTQKEDDSDEYSVLSLGSISGLILSAADIVTNVSGAAKKLYTALRPFVSSRPHAVIKIGPKERQLTLSNMSEESVERILSQAMKDFLDKRP